MDGSDHSRMSSSAPIKRSSTPKPTLSGTGTDENDISYQQMGMNFLSKKPMTKHFMIPTISASSKVIAPRNKILAERNEISDTNIQKDPNIDNSDGALSLSGASSSSPYDPLPNYPSPRPNFLRYKPNRRSEIVLHYENEVQGNISSPSKEDQEADLVCISQEEGEEVEEGEEEENEGFLRTVLKLMLVLVVLVSSTMYISSMNSPEVHSHTLQAIEGFRDGYLKIHDHVYGAMLRLGGEDHFLKRIFFKEILKKFDVGNEFLDGNTGLMKVNQTVVIDECIGEEVVKDVYMENVEEISINLSEVLELQVGDWEIEEKKKKGDGDLSEMMAELEGGESEDVFDQMVENFELKESEDIIEVESLLDNQMPPMSNAFEQQNDYVMEPVPEVNNLGYGDLEMLKSEMTEIENVTDKVGESVDTEFASLEILSFESEGELKEGFVGNIEPDKIFKAVIGVTMVLVIVAPLVLAFQLKRERNASRNSSPITKPSINQSGVAEICNSVPPNEVEEDMMRVDSFVSPPISLINSTVEDSKDLNQSRAPAVELLGEFVVEEISSSFRSRTMKSSKLEESEVSNYSVSLDKGFNSSKTYSSVPNHAPLDFSELSAINISPSYEDFTPQKMKMKKEIGRDGEANKVSTTPVRRSSRIRNRTITSP